VIQGFGNVGYWAAKFVHQDGAIVNTIIEYNSAIYSSKGFNPDDVKKYMNEKGTLVGYPKAEETNSDDPLSFLVKKCDVLLPAAVEKSIHRGNAE